MPSHPDPYSDLPAQPVQLHKGRGAASWIAHRFARDAREAFDDGWADPAANAAGTEGDDGEAAAALRTQLEWEQCKSALSRHDSPDLPFHLGLNPYRGCEHGWVCSAKGSIKVF